MQVSCSVCIVAGTDGPVRPLYTIVHLYHIIILYQLYRHGCPKVILSDQGREFINQVNKRLFELTKTEHQVSSAYHPQTNGLVERFNQTLQRSLLKLVNKEQNNWDEYIDGVLFAYRTSCQKSTKKTPFEVLYCRYVCGHTNTLIV